jgi:hypothetical protein
VPGLRFSCLLTIPFSVLASTDQAFGEFFSNSSASGIYSSDTAGSFDALLSYHILHGVYSELSISNQPQFIPTLLTNTSYTNMTGGQSVQAIAKDGIVTFGSAVNQVSRLLTPVRSGNRAFFALNFANLHP